MVAGGSRRVSRRFYCPELQPTTSDLTLAGNEGRHLAVVLRAAPGDRVILFNGRGLQADGTVRRVDSLGVQIEITAHLPASAQHRRVVTLATAVPKGDRFDWLVEKATELGVARVVPLVTSRSVVEPRDTRLEKLRRVIVEASKQCGRADLLDLAPLTRVSALLSESFPEGSLWVAHPGGGELPEVAPMWPAAVTFLIGPEGGWTEQEVATAAARGAGVMSLGPRLLRIETAGLALAALACSGLTQG